VAPEAPTPRRPAPRDPHERPVARQVAHREELRAALELVHDNYVRCGYMRPAPSGLRVCPQYALPQTRTYVALMRGQVVATVSLLPDSGLGLPLDGLYADEAAALRQRGRRLAEVGMLADRRRELTRGVDLLLALMKHVFHRARSTGVDDLLITVHPKHATFYRRLLRFEAIGPQRAYPSVRNAPAVLLNLPVADVTAADAPNDRIRSVFFSPVPPAERTGHYAMRREDLAWLLVEKSDLLRHLQPHEVRTIEACYPGLLLANLRGESDVA